MNNSHRSKIALGAEKTKSIDIAALLTSLIIEIDCAQEMLELMYMTRDPELLHLCRRVAVLSQQERTEIGMTVEKLINKGRENRSTRRRLALRTENGPTSGAGESSSRPAPFCAVRRH